MDLSFVRKKEDNILSPVFHAHDSGARLIGKLIRSSNDCIYCVKTLNPNVFSELR
jgi:hypothetical protein